MPPLDDTAQSAPVDYFSNIPAPSAPPGPDYFAHIAAPAAPLEWKEPPAPLQGTLDAPFEAQSLAEHTNWFKTAPKGSALKQQDGSIYIQPENPPPPPPSAIATGLHSAERAAVPTTAGVVGFGPGFAAGMGLGAFAGPLAPVASPVLGVLGGAITGYLSSKAAQAAQDVLASHVPDSIKEIAGQDESTREAEIKAHPWISKYLPEALNLAFLRPGAVANVAREAAGPVERFVVNQIAGRAPTSALMGAQTAGTEAAEGQSLDPSEIAKSVLIGGVLNRQTRLGKRALAIGEAPVRAIMPVPKNAAQDAAPPPPGAALPAGENPPPPPVGSSVIMPMPDGNGGTTPTPMTVAEHAPGGDVVLTDADGISHRIGPDRVATLTPAPPAAEAPAAEGAQGAPVPQAPSAAAPIPETPPVGASQPRTEADIEREDAEQRAALVGQAPVQADPVAQALAADQAEIAKPPIPRGIEATPSNVAPFRTQEQAALDQVPWSAEDTAKAGEPWPGYSQGEPMPTRTVTAAGEPIANENAPVGGAPAEPPAAEPVPAAGPLETQAARPAGLPVYAELQQEAARAGHRLSEAEIDAIRQAHPEQFTGDTPAARIAYERLLHQPMPERTVGRDLPASAANAAPEPGTFERGPGYGEQLKLLEEGAPLESRGSAEERPAFAEQPASNLRTAPFRDLRDDFDQSRSEADPHEASREWVTRKGTETGNEHLATISAGQIEHVGTNNDPSGLTLPSELFARLHDPDAATVLHHNHPRNFAPSQTDVALLAAKGAHAVVVHTPDGNSFAVSLTPQTRIALNTLSPREAYDSLKHLYAVSGDVVQERLQRFVDNGGLSATQAERIYADLVNRSLNAAGVTEYRGSRDSLPLHPPLVKSILRQAAQAVHVRIGEYGAQWERKIDDLLAQSTLTVRPDEAMAGLARGAEDATAGRLGGPGGDRGSGRGIGEAPPPEGSEGRSLAEERPDYTDEAERATAQSRDFIDEAISEPGERAADILGPPRKPPPPGMTGRVLNLFGAGPRSPGRGERWFNPVQRMITAPSNAARYDFGGVSRQKFDAEEAQRLRTETLRSEYVKELQPWLDLGRADQQKVVAALELARLQGRELPLDGRSIILENAAREVARDPLAHQPLAQNSRPGDLIRLDTPALINGITAYRRGTDRMYADFVKATAERHGWFGDPTAKAISARADAIREEPGQRAEAKRLDRVAKIVGAVEYARGNAYAPFMRQGDYFFRVAPKTGTPDKPGVPGWTGDGFAPTVWYSRINSRLPEEMIVGGTRTSSRTADAYRAELRKSFPEAEYEIQDGYYHPSEGRLRDLDIESIEDLFQIVNRDFKREWRDRIRSSETPDAERAAAEKAQELHDQAVDALLDTMYEKLKAGFRKQALNIPGYEPDLAKTTGIYTNWLASHNAALEHRAAIEAADKAVDGTYDPQTKRLWHELDRDQDRIASPLDFGASKLRQAAFYWMLGSNISSTIKILLHGPMLGFPVLSTGFGTLGRAGVAREYLAAFKDVTGTLGADTKRGANLSLLDAAKTPGERALLESNLASGRLRARGAEELGAIRERGIEALTPQQTFARRVLAAWSSNISAADQAIRGAMMLAAYRLAQKPGAMAKINRTWDRDALWAQQLKKTPEKFAEFMVDRSAGIWGHQNRAELARSLIGGMLYQFRSYELNFLSALHQQAWHMGPEGKVSAMLMLGSLGMMAGAMGLPFAQNIEQAYEWVHRMITGIDPNLNERFLQFMKDDPMGLGASAGKSVLYGVEPLGVDIGPGLSFGDLATRSAQSPIDILGPAASIFAGAPTRAYERRNQSTAAQVAELMPSAVRNLVRAFGVYPEEGVRSAVTGKTAVPPQDITAGDQAMVAAGLRPAGIGEAYRQQERQNRLTEMHTQAAKALNNQLKNLAVSGFLARQRGDQAGAQDYDARAVRLEANAPSGVRASAKAMRGAVGQAINPEAAAIRAAPKAVRGQVAQPLYTQP